MLIRLLKAGVHRMGRLYLENLNKSAWESQDPKRLNERAVEYGFVFTCLSQIAPRGVLDVGTGTTALPSLLKTCGYRVTAIDNIRDYWPQEMFNQHFHVLNDDILNPKLLQQLDVVLCISVLEHVIHYGRALTNMAALTRPGGHLIITCPYNERVGSPNVYEEQNSYGKGQPYICRQFTREDFQNWLRDAGMTVAKQEWWQFFDTNYWSCGTQVMPPRQALPDEQHQLTCMLIRRSDKERNLAK